MTEAWEIPQFTRVIIVRHALPEPDGTHDPGLGDVGRDQARRAASWIAAERDAGQPLSAVYASHMKRAVQTAQFFADTCGLQVQTDEDFREWPSSMPHYMPPEKLAHPERGKAFAEGRFEEFLPPHDRDELQQRMIAAVRRAAEPHPGGTIVIVSHGGALNSLLAHAVGTPRSFFFNPAYTGLSRLQVMPDGRIVPYSINETGHLR